MWRIKLVKLSILTSESRIYNCTLTGVSVTKGRSFLCIARVTNVCNLKLIDLWHFGPPGCRPAQSDLFHYTRGQKQTGKYRNWRVLMRSRGQSHGEQAPITLVLPAVVHISKVFWGYLEKSYREVLVSNIHNNTNCHKRRNMARRIRNNLYIYVKK